MKNLIIAFTLVSFPASASGQITALDRIADDLSEMNRRQERWEDSARANATYEQAAYFWRAKAYQIMNEYKQHLQVQADLKGRSTSMLNMEKQRRIKEESNARRYKETAEDFRREANDAQNELAKVRGELQALRKQSGDDIVLGRTVKKFFGGVVSENGSFIGREDAVARAIEYMAELSSTELGKTKPNFSIKITVVPKSVKPAGGNSSLGGGSNGGGMF